ncbi:UNVERIFIED_CONTAM: hypothetical protein Sradi_6553400 [Sesamum radiatum]|uniref:Retrotransposon gag domain-containing protein n=1 Tax=Sesamum radiatum TaxID=300843 RepID=A0AAW2JWF4_SESRA
MNKRVPKTAAFLFTIRQRENEPLRDYMQRFIEAVHEVPHINHELLASIIQQNLLPGRFKESIAGKPPSTMEDLLMRSQKYIRIEESNSSDPSPGVKRKGREEEKEPRKKEERKHGHTTEECHHLKNEIEKLIQRGHLRQYVNREQSRQPQETASTTPNSDNLPTAGVIAVISGGPAGGDSANAKALVRAARRDNWQTPNQIHNITQASKEKSRSANKT